jgi:AcrR family transcriptional regulator
MPHTAKSLERTDKIVQAAGRLFARQGYNGTSTREIAQLADVSENTLFRHFDHKEDIFWAAIRWQLTGLKPTQDLLSGIARGDSPEVVLPKIIEMLEDTVVYRSELLRLIAIAIIELPSKSDGLLSQFFTPVFSTIRKYLEVNIKNRTIRDLDSSMLTSAMIMTALTHPGIYSLIDGNKPVYSNSLEAHRTYVRFWLELIVPRMPAYPSPIARLTEEHPG